MKQISIFIENEIGKLAKVTDLLAKNGVNLKALSIADTLDYGILRIITDDTQKAHELLTENGYLARINEVIEVQIEDKPGALSKIINALQGNGQPDKYLIAMKYLESLESISAGQNNKVVYMPYEATGILSSIDGIKQMLNK